MDKLFNTDIRFLKGVGEKRALLFARLNVRTIGDLLHFYPRTYLDRTKISSLDQTQLYENATVIAEISSPIKEAKVKGGLLIYKFTVTDHVTDMQITLFNQKFLAAKLKVGQSYIFTGKIQGTYFRREMTSPEIEPLNEDNENGRIIPVYPLTSGLSRNIVASCVKSALSMLPEQMEEPLESEILEKLSLIGLKKSLLYIHNPKTFEQLNEARKYLVIEEFIKFRLGLLKLKTRNRQKTELSISNTDISPFLSNLPFKLTNAQNRVISECLADMTKDIPMSRLVQGDVGSGKTAVSAALIYAASSNGLQSALMAPTEILAQQHYKAMLSLLPDNIKIGLITGSMTKSQKLKIANAASNKEFDLLIGTHTLIEEYIEFDKLGLVITDEQHRFGVRQRSLLSSKGRNPHTLVMSATPIPRTLGLIIYGDLDISIIDELPPGRKKISTFLCDESYRQRLNGYIKDQCTQGRQVYIVCPLVEQNDKTELKAVDSYFENLKDNFPEISCGFVHGRLKPSEKEKIMQSFAKGETKILLATTVIEVGIDVPNATLMVIENAERFGLSQLHQLRGRVGRGEHKSYCILMSDNKSEKTLERLRIMTQTNDGFVISQKDLELRGPGDFFGQRQHGLPLLKIGSIYSDMELLKLANKIADKLYNENRITPALSKAVNSFFNDIGVIVFN
ncbi:MAG: ATP-dependent DNA helicase RecG [Ruminococcaceae bacterium]|nr:ATP-dependent DNA helicase RecG [Oscillospiraceae bacterium]